MCLYCFSRFDFCIILTDLWPHQFVQLILGWVLLLFILQAYWDIKSVQPLSAHVAKQAKHFLLPCKSNGICLGAFVPHMFQPSFGVAGYQRRKHDFHAAGLVNATCEQHWIRRCQSCSSRIHDAHTGGGDRITTVRGEQSSCVLLGIGTLPVRAASSCSCRCSFWFGHLCHGCTTFATARSSSVGHWTYRASFQEALTSAGDTLQVITACQTNAFKKTWCDLSILWFMLSHCRKTIVTHHRQVSIVHILLIWLGDWHNFCLSSTLSCNRCICRETRCPWTLSLWHFCYSNRERESLPLDGDLFFLLFLRTCTYMFHL